VTASAVTALPSPAPRADPDLPLVRGMARGDEAALRTLYARHRRGVWAYVLGQVGDPSLAEEVLQDVMLAAWRGAGAFRAESKVRTWLLTIAHNRAQNAVRRRNVPGVPLGTLGGLGSGDRDGADDCDDCDDGAAVPGGEVEAGRDDHAADAALVSADARFDLLAAVDALASDHRAVLDLVFFHDLSVAEAAQVLGVAAGTVKSRLFRARAALRYALVSAEAHGIPVIRAEGADDEM
jgi:RNA polymerase sigma factor (sigma-70 family)